MNAIGADQNIAAHRQAVCAVAIEEVRGNAAFVLRE
jgi:hypothetical protein